MKKAFNSAVLYQHYIRKTLENRNLIPFGKTKALPAVRRVNILPTANQETTISLKLNVNLPHRKTKKVLGKKKVKD